jgi:hypothetical protein
MHCVRMAHTAAVPWLCVRGSLLYPTLPLMLLCVCMFAVLQSPKHQSQLIRDLKADALLETNIPIPGSYDSCSCILSHVLGLPRVLANGCALFNGPASVPQVNDCYTIEPAAAATCRSDRTASLLACAQAALTTALLSYLQHETPCQSIRHAVAGSFAAAALLS